MRRFGARCQGLAPGLGIAVVLGCWLGVAGAQDVTRDPTVRRGEMDFTYQYSEEQNLVTSIFGTIPTPVFTSHVLDFNFRYALGQHWTVQAGLPVISRKIGEAAHNHDPMLMIPPHPESKFVDDGDFHTFFQDLQLGARYLLLTDPVIVEPYITYGLPASDYPFFAASGIGQHLWKTEIGSTFAYRPPFLRWFFSLEVGYVYVEETLNTSVNTTRVNAEAVYFVNPRIAVKAFVSSKNGTGIAPPVPDFTSDVWYHHDQMVRHNYMNGGVGMDWSLSDRNVLNVSLVQMIHAEDVFDLRGALSVSLSRTF